jgi:tryptophan halogenase
VVLEDGSIYTADLFIDCTGFKSLLLGGALEEPFESKEDQLVNNRAWAIQLPYKDKEKELEPFTNGTAIENGWCWNIPLWSRLGTGYVYSDKYISDETALNEFKKHL